MHDMSEASINLQQQLDQETSHIEEDMRKIKEFRDIVFVPGQEEKIGCFPMFEALGQVPVLARFSYGRQAPNMSSVFFDKETESEVITDRNVRIFLQNNGFHQREQVIQALGKFQGQEPQIEEVNYETLTDKVKSVGNVVFTRDPRVTLIIKPADCPTGIFYCKDKDGNPVTGIIHGGAEAANYGLIRQGIQALQIELGVDLSTLKIGLFPGMKDYTMSRHWIDPSDGKEKDRYDGFYPINLGEYLEPAKTQDPLEKRKVDLTSVFEMQALQAGVRPQNMEVYRLDTYADAARGRAYSRRYSNDHDGARPGGNLIAVRLKPSPAEQIHAA